MKRIPTVTIGTAAYNEEANIESMLRSIAMQNEKRIRIKQILIISDGSSDKTVVKVKRTKDPRVKVISYKGRKGQSARLREVFHRFKTDYLVIMDADTVLGDKKAIENIVSPMIIDSNLGAIAGNTIPLPGRTFLERSINNYIFARQSLQKEYDFGQKAFVAHSYLAYSKAFAKKCLIPDGILNFDAYSYFAVRQHGFIVGYAHNSVCFYRSASTIREYVNQTTRHMAGGHQLRLYFEDSIVSEEYTIPGEIMRKILLYQVKKSVLGYIFLKALFTLASYRSRSRFKTLDTRWDYVGSTKSTIPL